MQKTALLISISGITLLNTLNPALSQTIFTNPTTENFHPSLAQQPDPNRDRLIQPSDELPQPLNSEPLLTPPSSQTSDFDNNTPLNIQTIEVIGSTIFDDTDFAPILANLTGQTTLGRLNQAVAAITQLYLDAGYITSRAFLPSQSLSDGQIQIRVLEGQLTDLEITGLNHLQERYITTRLRQNPETPLNINQLEEQLQLLKLDANVADFDASLAQDEALGTSRLQLNITEANPFFGTVFTDNYSPAAIGSTRMGANLGYRNLWGIGDTAGLGYTFTPAGGSHIWDFNYAVPVNAMNGTIQARFVSDRNRIIRRPFNALNIRGASQLYDLSYRQPLVRTLREEVALSVGFSHKRGQTFLFNNIAQPFGIGAAADGTTRTSVLRFGQEYTRRDQSGAWGVRSQFNLGLGLFDATDNPGPIPDGQFFSWLGQVSRIERFSPKHSMIVQADLQLTGDSLLSSETFSLGGGPTLRGYRQGARSGDNGFRLVVENRVTLLENQKNAHLLQLAPFLDVGYVWNNGSNPQQIFDNKALVGLGLGVIWQPIQPLALRLDFTFPAVNLRDRQTDLQDDGIYFSLNYGF